MSSHRSRPNKDPPKNKSKEQILQFLSNFQTLCTIQCFLKNIEVQIGQRVI